MPRELLISEIFGPTFQGEGPSTGQQAFFVRLGACNLSCKWCDTPYTWAFGKRGEVHEGGKTYDPKVELKRMPIVDVAHRIRASGCSLVVFTGGEPMLQQHELSELISLVNEEPLGPRFEIETAGTIAPTLLKIYENVSFNVSPKLANSGNSLGRRYNQDALEQLRYTGRAIFKFVLDTRFSGADLEGVDDVKQIAKAVRIPAHKIWLMPVATSTDALATGLRDLAPIALDNGWNLSGRLHVVLWGDERGH